MSVFGAPDPAFALELSSYDPDRRVYPGLLNNVPKETLFARIRKRLDVLYTQHASPRAVFFRAAELYMHHIEIAGLAALDNLTDQEKRIVLDPCLEIARVLEDVTHRTKAAGFSAEAAELLWTLKYDILRPTLWDHVCALYKKEGIDGQVRGWELEPILDLACFVARRTAMCVGLVMSQGYATMAICVWSVVADIVQDVGIRVSVDKSARGALNTLKAELNRIESGLSLSVSDTFPPMAGIKSWDECFLRKGRVVQLLFKAYEGISYQIDGADSWVVDTGKIQDVMNLACMAAITRIRTARLPYKVHLAIPTQCTVDGMRIICYTYHFKEFQIVQNLSRKDARRYMKHLCVALDHLHALGIICKDLTPENICVDTSHELVIENFECAEVCNMAEPRHFQKCPESVRYTAPELIAPWKNGTYSFPVDMWSLGIVFLELGLGKYPFDPASTWNEQLANYMSACGAPSWLKADPRQPASFHVRTTDPQGALTSKLVHVKDNHIIERALGRFGADAVDLGRKLLALDPDERIAAHEAIKHAFLS